MSEFELKLRIPADRLAAVAKAVRRGRSHEERLQARYFDTPGRDLSRHGIVLRLRKEGRQWVQTAKATGDGPLHRLEHNVPLGTAAPAAPDPRLHAGTDVGARIEAALARAREPQLAPAFRTDVQRLSRVVVAGGTAVELALDTGEIAAGRRSVPVAELELELKQGSRVAAIELASEWAQKHGLWLGTVSKAQRGWQLAAGDVAVGAQAATPPQFKSRAGGAAIVRAIVGSALDQLLANGSELAEGHAGDEHVHQMRVGLRRLRTALRELAPLWPMLPDESVEVLTHVFRELGRHRNVAYLAPHLQDGIAAAGGPQLAWELQERALPDLQAVVRDPAFQQVLLALLARLAADADDSGLPHAQARAWVGDRLGKLHRQVRKAGRRFTQLPHEEQHHVRKHLKRLRYLAEFTRPLFKGREVDAFVKALKPLQDALGAYQDTLVALELWRDRAEAEPAAWFGAGWLSAQRDAMAEDCERQCRAFVRAAKPFWD
jgi:inorganic triphosphatase YgiF